MSDKPALVLVGPPAAGKSRLAKRVAKMMNLPLVDTDSMVVQEHGPIKDIFANHGEDVFRAWERAAVITALETPGIVALGGGAVMDPATREDLRNHTVALITISPEAVEDRISGDKRPLLSGGIESWVSLMEQRAGWYEEVAGVSFDTSHRAMDTLAVEIVDWVKGAEHE